MGKTSLRRNYMGVGFSESYVATLGADFSNKDVVFEDTGTVRIQIWDIAGQLSFSMIRGKFLRGAGGAIVIYDITRTDTFDKIMVWLEEVWGANQTNNIPLLIVGNKIDLADERSVNKVEAFKFCENIKQRFDIPFVKYIETSAKTGENVNDAFEQLTRGILEISEDD